MSGSQPAALKIASVGHDFGGGAVLDGVGFSVSQGGFCALLGPNGAGKTTLASLITRLYTCREGTIEVFGADLAQRPQAALARIGIVFQQRALDLDLTVMQNLRYQGALHGLPDATTCRRAAEELERIGLADKADTVLRKLSGGQIRRVEIARALLHRPGLLLLDEPTAGLDPAARRHIHDHVLSLCAQGVAAVWCTHLIDEVVPDCQLVVLDCGKVRADDIARNVCKRTGTRTIGAAYARLTGAAGAGVAA